MVKLLERLFENALFASRWLLAPFFVGLIVALAMLLVVFARELVAALPTALTISVEDSILGVLTLLDLTLAANLILIVVLAGYENFVSKIDTEGHEDRPGWMGTTSFSGLKLKLFASIVAISGIQLLKSFMALGHSHVDREVLMWMAIIHVTFVVTALLSACTDYLSSRGGEAH